ncbi:MAG: hypothetical protein UX04_C0006G0094, partial [Microgenomates group bacterium GW2011_GWF2_45_18]
AKNAFVYIKETEKSVIRKNEWLEPENSPIDRTKKAFLQMQSDMERVKGIEPSSHPWEGCILPLNHTRNASNNRAMR